jgi:hypothetical protein
MEINEEVTDPKTRRVNHEPISRALIKWSIFTIKQLQSYFVHAYGAACRVICRRLAP